MKIILVTCLLVSTTIGLTSCAFINERPAEYSAAAKKEVSKGMSKAQVVAILGKPLVKMTVNNQENWSYQKMNYFTGMLAPFGVGSNDSSSVTVKFNASGKVVAVETQDMSIRPSMF